MNQRRLSRIEVFVFDAPWPFHHATESSGKCRYGVLKLTCKAGCSWGAGILSAEGDHFDVIKWSSFLRSIRNHRLEEAIEIVQQLGAQWEPGQQEIVQTALLDLKARLQGKVVTSHLQMVPYSRTAGAGGTPPFRRMYYKPSSSLLHKGSWQEPDIAELMDRSIAYFSIL